MRPATPGRQSGSDRQSERPNSAPTASARSNAVKGFASGRDAPAVHVNLRHALVVHDHAAAGFHFLGRQLPNQLGHLAVDLVGRDVAVHRSHRVEDQLTLRGHAQAMLLERAA